MSAIVFKAVDVARPYTALCPSLESEVLVVLHGTTRPLTGREVARLARRGSQPGVRRALQRLVEHGLVDVREAGRALLYTLNRDHLAAPAVAILAAMRAELERRLRAEIEEWEIAPEHASIFGSAARGDGDTASDIDLFVVRPDQVDEGDSRWREQLDRLAADARRWTGNHVGISEVSKRELRRLRRERPPVIEDLRSDSVTLAGPAAQALLGGRT